MANLGGSWAKPGTEDVVRVADIPGRVAAHLFELRQLFSDADHPTPGAEVVKVTHMRLNDLCAEYPVLAGF